MVHPSRTPSTTDKWEGITQKEVVHISQQALIKRGFGAYYHLGISGSAPRASSMAARTRMAVVIALVLPDQDELPVAVVVCNRQTHNWEASVGITSIMAVCVEVD